MELIVNNHQHHLSYIKSFYTEKLAVGATKPWTSLNSEFNAQE